jgi:hypothetical protein
MDGVDVLCVNAQIKASDVSRDAYGVQIIEVFDGIR